MLSPKSANDAAIQAKPTSGFTLSASGLSLFDRANTQAQQRARAVLLSNISPLAT